LQKEKGVKSKKKIKNKFMKQVSICAYLDGLRQFMGRYSDKSDELFDKS